MTIGCTQAGSDHLLQCSVSLLPLPPVLVAAWLGILAQLKRAAAWCWCWLVAACDGAQVDIYDAAEVRQGEGRAFSFTHHNITSLCLN